MRILITAVAALAFASPVMAQGWIEPSPGIRCECSVQRTRTSVSVRVTGRVARVEVEEWFRNQGAGILGQADYLYPLPGEAVFSNFSLFQGDQELTGETMDAGQARSIYEEIVRKKRDPALIELAGHGLIRARVFPINPGETRKITLRYTQVLSRAGDALQFRYAAGRPSTQMPRAGTEAPWPSPDNVPLSFQMQLDSAGQFGEPFSPTHQIHSDRAGDRLTVHAPENLSGDFSLFLPLSRGLVGLTVATHRPSSEDGYFMLTLSPGRGHGEVAQSRDVTAVVDVSGSMSGSKITQARTALRQLLASLNRSDRFRLIAFNGSVRSYRGGWTDATADEVSAAQRWVEQLTADGGTNIEAALREAFQASSPDSRLPIVLFVTDGLPSVGEQNPERIAAQAEQARGRSRIFAFGVGYDVNTYLLDRLTAAGRGTTQYVQTDGEVETALGSLITKISTPVLTDLQLADAPASLRDIYPAQLPDLFAGEELVIFGRYAGNDARRGPLVVTGRRNGVTERFSVDAAFPSNDQGNDFIPRLWASRKIGVLTRTMRLEGATPALEREIRETALRYGILSEFTSYLVQEPVVTVNRQNLRRDRPFSDPIPGSGAPAPAQASGQGAVRMAAEAQQMRAARSTADLDAMDKLEASAISVDATTRRVGGRMFIQRNGAWVDTQASDTLRLATIEPFSDAYFRLLQALPELKPYAQAFEHVVIAGRSVRIEIGSGGMQRIDAAGLDRIVREFRGK